MAVPNYATYTWNFGDETPEVSGYAPGAPACETPWLSPCAASEFHSYTYNGTYTVTLRVTDVGGNEAQFSAPVTVVEGQERPPPPPPAATGTGNAKRTIADNTVIGAVAAQASSSSGTTRQQTGRPPVATAAISSTSLKTRPASKGLGVRYSVNEQVAGHFEVLLAASVAEQIGLHGAARHGARQGHGPRRS